MKKKHVNRQILILQFDQSEEGFTIQILHASKPLPTPSRTNIPPDAGFRFRAHENQESADRSGAAVILGEAIE